MRKRQTWLITGAGRGLGRALAEGALAAGHRVVATVRSGDPDLEHPELSVLRLDVRDRSACVSVVAEAEQATGGVDVLVNNAGYGLVGAIEEVSEADARAIIDTDLLGPLWLTQAVVPGMRERGSGHILQVSSVGGVGAMPFLGLYNAAKWGLEGFSEALAGELAPFGIRVTIAELGAMDTEWGTGSMRFADPLGAYDQGRCAVLGTSDVPWVVPHGTTAGGTPPAQVAASLVRHVDAGDAGRLRIVLGDGAAEQVLAAMDRRSADYRDLADRAGVDARS